MKNQVMQLLKQIDDLPLSSIMEIVHGFSKEKGNFYDYLDLMLLWYRDILMYKATKDTNLLLYRDEYSTINLQEALAKNIAEMLAEEDMEASDATKALPVDSIFQATTQKIEDMPAFREEEKKEEQEAEPAPESVEEEATGIENTEQDNESAEVAEISSEEKETVEEPEEEVSETEVSEEIPETEELEEIEEAEPVEESLSLIHI